MIHDTKMFDNIKYSLFLTMFLTSCYVLRPVTGVGFLVVEKTADTELFRGSSVPTGPIPGAGGLVPEDAVQPVAMFSTLGRI